MEQGAQRGEAALDRLGNKAQRTENIFTRLTKSINPLKAAFTSLVGIGIGQFFHNTVRAAAEFKTRVAEVSTLVDAATFDMDRLTAALERQAVQFGSPAPRQAAAAYQIISAGAQDAAQAIEILDAANRLAIGGVTDVAIAADGLTTILNAYGDQVESAEAVSDILFIGMRAGKTTIEELSSSLGSVVPLAATAGVGFDELVASIAALTTGGISTAEAVTGMRAVLASVASPSQQAARLARDLGIEFNQAAIQSQGLAGFLQDVIQRTNGSTESLAVLFGGVQALVPILALSGEAGRSFADILEQMDDASGATAEAFARMSNTFEFQSARMQQIVTAGMRAIGNVIKDFLTPIFRTLADNFENITRFATVFATALAVAAVPAVMALTPAILAATKALIGMAAAFALTPFGAILTTITALSAAITFFADTTFEMAGEQFTLWEGLRVAVSMVWDAIKLGIEIARDVFKQVTGFVGGFFRSVVEWLGGFVSNWEGATSGVGEIIRNAINTYIGLWVGLLQSIRPVIVDGIPNLFRLAMASAYNIVLRGIQNIVNAVVMGLGGVGDALDFIPGISGVGDSIRDALRVDFTDLEAETESYRRSLESVGQTVRETFEDSMSTDYVGAFSDAVGEAAGALRDEFITRLQEARDTADELGDNTDAATVATETLTDAITPLGASARGAADAMRDLNRERQEFIESVTEEFARLQASQGGAVAAVQAWYLEQTTLLRELGLQYTEYASMLEAIFDDRLASAYQRDLQNATDWRSGIERAVANLGATIETEADLAEKALTSMFDGAARALADFVTKGEVDFKQFARSIISDIIAMTTRMLLFRALFGLFPGLGMLGGFGGGGIPFLQAATGGYISGPGTPTSDSIPALLSDGEFVVNAAATSRFRPMLEAINSGDVPRYSLGGPVGRQVSSSGDDDSRGGMPSIMVNIQTRDAESFRQSRGQVAADIARAVAFGQRSM